MRWVASLFALSLMMGIVHHLTAPGPLEARAALALGFLWIAAWLGGELARAARQPRIVGFLLAGFFVGPGWLHLVRPDELAALRLFSDAAMVLVALAAGREVNLATLRAARSGFLRLTGAAIVAPFAAVAFVTATVSHWFPLTVHQSFGSALAVVLVLAAVTTVSSPIATVAVMDELEARGPFARGVLAVTVAQTVAVSVLLPLILLLAAPLARPGTLTLGVAGVALAQLAGSLTAGVVLGELVLRYRRLARRDDALILAAAGMAAALGARSFGLEVILVGLGAGIYLANAPTDRAPAPPRGGTSSFFIAVVTLFALAGAGLEVGVLADLWPWVLLLVSLRVVALRYGFRWAGRAPDVTQALAREGWLGLISQAGVALAVAPLARRAFPASGVSLEALIVASAAVYDVAGPICWRRGLARVGELRKEEHEDERPYPEGTVGGGDRGGGLRRSSDGAAVGDLRPDVPAPGTLGGAVPGARPDPHAGVCRLSGQRIGHRFRGVSARAPGDDADARPDVHLPACGRLSGRRGVGGVRGARGRCPVPRRAVP
jgi:Kef-type K+ transport system membrane component KefB